MRRALAFALVAALAPTRGAAQLADHPRIREATHLLAKWLDAQRAYERIPGLSAAVVADQEVIWTGGSGYADLAAKRPATAETIYSICSISKLFTSIAVMQLRDQGKLRLDDPVAKHLSWFDIRRRHPESGEITIEGLLTHSSGLPREAAYPYWSGPDFKFPTHEEIVSALSSEETLYPTRTFFQYSNLGLTLAGEIVAAESGMPYAEYVTTRILRPLGLASTTPEIPVAERGRRLATGYGPWEREGDRTPLPFLQVKGIAPAAGYASTVEDLARFAAWQFRLLQYRSTEVLAPNTLREMHRIHFVDPSGSPTWGLGFVASRDGKKNFVGHGGSCPGYQTSLLLEPDERIAVTVMTNGIDVNAGRLSRGSYAIMAPAIAAARDSTPPKPADSSLAAYTGTYDEAWGGETEILVWEGGLAAIGLPTDDPVEAITKLRKVGRARVRQGARGREARGAMDLRRGTRRPGDGPPPELQRGPEGSVTRTRPPDRAHPTIRPRRTLHGSSRPARCPGGADCWLLARNQPSPLGGRTGSIECSRPPTSSPSSRASPSSSSMAGRSTGFRGSPWRSRRREPGGPPPSSTRSTPFRPRG